MPLVRGGVIGFDQSATVLAGIPQATLVQWQSQLQQAMLTWALGQRPTSLSYTQGDGTKSVTYALTSLAEVRNMLLLVNRALGLGPGRSPIRPYFA